MGLETPPRFLSKTRGSGRDCLLARNKWKEGWAGHRVVCVCACALACWLG